jgi:hypothetical protein
MAGLLTQHWNRDEEIRSLLGEPSIISFEHTESGARVVICR